MSRGRPRAGRALVESCFFFFFNDTATTEIYTLSLHDALPIFIFWWSPPGDIGDCTGLGVRVPLWLSFALRSEEHTSELQSHLNLVCRLLLEKKKIKVSTALATTPSPGQSPCRASGASMPSRSC